MPAPFANVDGHVILYGAVTAIRGRHDMSSSCCSPKSAGSRWAGWALHLAASWHASWHCNVLCKEAAAEVECYRATCSDLVIFVSTSMPSTRYFVLGRHWYAVMVHVHWCCMTGMQCPEKATSRSEQGCDTHTNHVLVAVCVQRSCGAQHLAWRMCG